MPHHTKQWCKRQAQRFKRQIRRQRESEKRVEARREKLSQLVGAHLARDEEDPWRSLEQVLKNITKNLTFEALFKREQKDPQHFKEGVTNRCARLDRDAVGPRKGTYHLAFFAFAPEFEGKPHSHAVNCVSAVLHGKLGETLYSLDEEGRLKIISDELRARGSVVADLPKPAAPPFIHSVSNPSAVDHKRGSIVYSLHVYGACRGTLFNHYYDPSLVNKSGAPAKKGETGLKIR